MQECLWILWKPCMERLLLKVLERKITSAWSLKTRCEVNFMKAPVQLWNQDQEEAFYLLFNHQLTATPFRPSSYEAPPTFSKFEEKKNIEKGSRYNTVRRLFWGSSSPQKHQGRSDNFVYSYIVSSVPQSLDFPDLSETSPNACLFRVLGKPCKHVKSLSGS